MNFDPFRTHRRQKRDERDAARAEIREKVEPVPDVICTQCSEQEVMEYNRNLSAPQIDAPSPLIEATWECPNCDKLAFGYVIPEGLTSILDNARPKNE